MSCTAQNLHVSYGLMAHVLHRRLEHFHAFGYQLVFVLSVTDAFQRRRVNILLLHRLQVTQSTKITCLQLHHFNVAALKTFGGASRIFHPHHPGFLLPVASAEILQILEQILLAELCMGQRREKSPHKGEESASAPLTGFALGPDYPHQQQPVKPHCVDAVHKRLASCKINRTLNQPN